MKPKLTPLLFLVLLGMSSIHCTENSNQNNRHKNETNQKGIIGGSGVLDLLPCWLHYGGGPNEYIGDNGTNGTNTDQSNAKSCNIAAKVSIHGAVIPKPDDNVAGTSLEVCILYHACLID